MTVLGTHVTFAPRPTRPPVSRTSHAGVRTVTQRTSHGPWLPTSATVSPRVTAE